MESFESVRPSEYEQAMDEANKIMKMFDELTYFRDQTVKNEKFSDIDQIKKWNQGVYKQTSDMLFAMKSSLEVLEKLHETDSVHENVTTRENNLRVLESSLKQRIVSGVAIIDTIQRYCDTFNIPLPQPSEVTGNRDVQ